MPCYTKIANEKADSEKRNLRLLLIQKLKHSLKNLYKYIEGDNSNFAWTCFPEKLHPIGKNVLKSRKKRNSILYL